MLQEDRPEYFGVFINETLIVKTPQLPLIFSFRPESKRRFTFFTGCRAGTYGKIDKAAHRRGNIQTPRALTKFRFNSWPSLRASSVSILDLKA
jgi:hypothetical protein